MHFRTAEWEEKLLAWHLTTVSMNKTHSTFETSLLKVSLCICAQRHKTTGLQHFWQSSKKPFNLPASTGTHHCEGTRLCFYCKPTVPLWGLQPTKVVVIEVLPVLFARECEGKDSPLGQNINGRHPSKSPQEESFGVTGRMTAPPQTEAKSYRRTWCNIPWLLPHLRRWP